MAEELDRCVGYGISLGIGDVALQNDFLRKQATGREQEKQDTNLERSTHLKKGSITPGMSGRLTFRNGRRRKTQLCRFLASKPRSLLHPVSRGVGN